MQFMPDTWRAIAKGKDITNPEHNIGTGVKYLTKVVPSELKGLRNPSIPYKIKKILSDPNLNACGVTKEQAVYLAGYNAGAGKVIRFKGIPPYSETVNYVANIVKRCSLLEKHYNNTAYVQKRKES